jgi:hypothetical protein
LASIICAAAPQPSASLSVDLGANIIQTDRLQLGKRLCQKTKLMEGDKRLPDVGLD